MRKDVMMISAGLMMMAMASCNQTEYREITEDRVVTQPVDTIKVADHFYLDGYLSRTSEHEVLLSLESLHLALVLLGSE